ncbi:MAG: hypothetical protein OEM02_14470 [Desulfobulbaceae bacterium]|nr:hypothetical protein [Desulfobulbaceae bacterium]
MKIHKNIHLALIWTCIGLISLCIFTAVETSAKYFDVVLPWNLQFTLKNVCQRAGLENFPDSANTFEREMVNKPEVQIYKISFFAPLIDIRKWIWKSKGINSRPYRIDADWIRYDITSRKNGITGGWVKINENKNRVCINLSCL